MMAVGVGKIIEYEEGNMADPKRTGITTGRTVIETETER